MSFAANFYKYRTVQFQFDVGFVALMVPSFIETIHMSLGIHTSNSSRLTFTKLY